jgi:hypothetical protein
MNPSRVKMAARVRLSRTASLERIRQFPAYCYRGVLPHALTYLQTSSTAIQAGLAVVRGCLLAVALYLGLLLLTFQLSACCWALLLGAKPPGLVFMLASLLAMCAMASRTIVHDSTRQTL